MITKSIRSTQTKRKVYLYSKGDYDKLDQVLLTKDWTALFGSGSMEEKWAAFKETYFQLVDDNIPSKTINPGKRHKPPWCNYRSVKKAKKEQRALWIQYRRSGLESDRLLYEEQRKATDDIIKKAKANYEEKLVERIKTDPKPFWNYSRISPVQLQQ